MSKSVREFDVGVQWECGDSGDFDMETFKGTRAQMIEYAHKIIADAKSDCDPDADYITIRVLDYTDEQDGVLIVEETFDPADCSDDISRDEAQEALDKLEENLLICGQSPYHDHRHLIGEQLYCSITGNPDGVHTGSLAFETYREIRQWAERRKNPHRAA